MGATSSREKQPGSEETNNRKQNKLRGDAPSGAYFKINKKRDKVWSRTRPCTCVLRVDPPEGEQAERSLAQP